MKKTSSKGVNHDTNEEEIAIGGGCSPSEETKPEKTETEVQASSTVEKEQVQVRYKQFSTE